MIDIAVCMAMINDEYEQSEFERLYLDNRQNAYAVAYKILHNDFLAEDAVSEAFLRIAKIFDRISHLDSVKLKHYTMSAVRNTALNILKKERHFAENASYSDEILYDNCNNTENEDMVELIKLCMSKLSYTDHEILYLRISRDLKFKEIAKLLGISQTAARQRFWVAKNNLKKILGKDADKYE